MNNTTIQQDSLIDEARELHDSVEGIVSNLIELIKDLDKQLTEANKKIETLEEEIQEAGERD